MLLFCEIKFHLDLLDMNCLGHKITSAKFVKSWVNNGLSRNGILKGQSNVHIFKNRMKTFTTLTPQSFRSRCSRVSFLIGKDKGVFTVKRGFKVKNTQTKVEGTTVKKNARTRIKKENGKAGRSSDPDVVTVVVKSGLFTAGFTVLVFGGCAIWQEENSSKQDEFWREGIKRPSQQKKGEVRRDLNYIWNHLSKVHKITYAIIAANIMIWGAWKLATPQIMSKWFTLQRLNFSNLTMIFSAFSHKSFIHLYVNMFVLLSFCPVWNQLALKNYWSEPVNTPERYLAFYLTAGVFGSLLSIIVKTKGRIPQASLGASGAIMGLIGYTCQKLPNNMLSVIFLPQWSFSADSAKHFILAFDSIGLLIGALSSWRYMIFDHAGHLGGMLFGILYATYGEKILHRFSEFVMVKYRDDEK